MTLREKLTAIQAELKAPKNGYNRFGNYKYRSFEQICEAVKPLLEKHGCTLFVTDAIVPVGDRYYIEATASLLDHDPKNANEVFSVKAYARESAEKKGMDASQVTGTASSYARKYAFNGLFLIDDTRDPDTDEYHEQTHPEDAKAKPEDIRRLIDAAADKNVTTEQLLSRVAVENIEELTVGMVAMLTDLVDRSTGGTQ